MKTCTNTSLNSICGARYQRRILVHELFDTKLWPKWHVNASLGHHNVLAWGKRRINCVILDSFRSFIGSGILPSNLRDHDGRHFDCNVCSSSFYIWNNHRRNFHRIRLRLLILNSKILSLVILVHINNAFPHSSGGWLLRISRQAKDSQYV